ncbi:universal stress protein [Mangrovivirga sp. M17]|uniref:Universal stress protein n=1 Tax=Mangrovivirga halotolerans TaxID=2993936 RepID=A0ABT3RTV7_9BACT|nr:universal stress protein [Mangrovivirga halotolerans]MCX2744774.1 universal stress protein [Mangrovivirga halotolerans]
MSNLEVSHILVPVNFSKASYTGLKFAINIARQLNAKLTVLHVFNIPQPVGGLPLYIEEDNDPAVFSSSIAKKFKKLEEEYLFDSGIDYDLQFKLGYLETRLSAFVEYEKVDLIVLGKKDPSGFMSFLKINIVRILNSIGCPSIIIPEQYEGCFPFKKACISCDYSKKNKKKDLADSALILKILSLDQILLSVTQESLKQRFSEEKEKVLKILSETLPDIQTVQVPQKSNEFISKTILKKVLEINGDLIVVFPGKHFYNGLFSESVSKSLANNKSIPMLVIN